VPVFPLPGLVFFPQTLLPLHIFEPRYRKMVRDAVAADGLIAMALLCEDESSGASGRPRFHGVGTIGSIEELEPFDDGRFDLVLRGLERVDLFEVVSSEPYRLVEACPRPQIALPSDAVVERAKLDLLASHALLRSQLGEEPLPLLLIEADVSFETAVNATCAALPIEAAARQALLEEDDIFRRQERAAASLHEMLETLLRIRAIRGGDAQTGPLN
jgi:Lon protease-like protein